MILIAMEVLGFLINALHSYGLKGCTVLMQIRVPPRCIPECAASMLASPDDALESQGHILARPPEGERSTLLSDPRYHTPGIQNGVQEQEKRKFAFPLTSDFRFS